MTASVESSGGRRQVTVGSTCGQSLDSRVLGCRLREPFTAFQAFVDSTDLTGQEQTRPLRPWIYSGMHMDSERSTRPPGSCQNLHRESPVGIRLWGKE